MGNPNISSNQQLFGVRYMNESYGFLDALRIEADGLASSGRVPLQQYQYESITLPPSLKTLSGSDNPYMNLPGYICLLNLFDCVISRSREAVKSDPGVKQAGEIEGYFSGGCVIAQPNTTCSGRASIAVADAATLQIKRAIDITSPIPAPNVIIGDAQGALYISGSGPTNSVFPLVNPIQSGGGNTDAFVTVFAPVTGKIVFSTYLGGTGSDQSNGIALDPQGNIYIAGQTTSGDFPTKNALQPTPPAPNGAAQGQGNSFIAKISAIKPIEETGFAVDDSDGNHNGIIDPNECVGLSVALTNASANTLTGITTTLSTNTPGVVITQVNSAYADLSSGGSGTNNTPFKLSTSSSFACGTKIDLSLGVTTNQGSFTFPFQLSTGSLGIEKFVSSTTSVPIPDNNPAGADSPITVSGITGPVSEVDIVFLYLTHTRDSDLTISLIGPDNTTVILSDRRGGAGANYGTDCPADGNDTLFNAEPGTRPLRIGDGSPPFVRSLGFLPDQPLSAFKGKPANGTWKLRVVDNATGNTGTIQCWSMFLTPFSCADGSGPCSTATPTPTPIQLMLDLSGPGANQVAALNTLFLRDPFPVMSSANFLNPGVDKNTRVTVFVTNLLLLPGETSSSVIVNLTDSNNQIYDTAAEDVRLVPDFNFTQVTFRLPNNLSTGTCVIRVKAHGQVSNAGNLRIRI